jgi:hypothetical protein
MNPDTFPLIILIGRPAAGKSEVIEYLKRTPIPERVIRFHIGDFEEIDDFPMLWSWFEEDAILEKILGKPRIYTDPEGYFLHRHQWDLLIERICLEYKKKLREAGYHDRHTTILEFSRGREHGGYAAAFAHLSDEVIEKAAIVFIRVSYEESLRKNRRRFNPARPDSILEHGLPDSKLERLYREIDWEEISAGSPTHVTIKGHEVPYMILQNEPEVTHDPERLGKALEELFGGLWTLMRKG